MPFASGCGCNFCICFGFGRFSLLFENPPYSSDKDHNDMGFIGMFQIFVQKRPYVYSEKIMLPLAR